MTSMVSKASSSSSCQVSPSVSIEEKGSRNKRKFRADPLVCDQSEIILSPQIECPTYEFSAEKFEINPCIGQPSACDLCSVNQDHSDGLKLDLGLSSAIGSSEVGPSWPREEIEAGESQDADWSDLTEAHLEELVLSNLDAIFKSAIKKIVACGCTEEVATKAVLRSGICYGYKDTVTNIVDNALAFLRSGQEIDPSREYYFEDLEQLEKYVLAELVCVLQEVRPFFSTGDAMWCLLICDMNVSHACAVGGDHLSTFACNGSSSGISYISTQPQLKTETKGLESNLPSPLKPFTCSRGTESEAPTMVGVPNLTKSKSSLVLNGLVSEKEEGTNTTSDTVDRSFNVAGTCQSPAMEEKFGGSRKTHSGSTKREYMLRQKQHHVDKHYRTYASRGGKLSGSGGLILDKKLKSVTDSTAINLKNASLNISKPMGVSMPLDNCNRSLSTSSGPSSSAASDPESVNNISALSKTNILTKLHEVSFPLSLASVSTPPPLSAANTELSLSLSTKSNSALVPVSGNVEPPKNSYAEVPYDRSQGQWIPRDRKDEMILKLVPRVRELQNQLHEWTEWANQKVMQAARRLGKDKAELKTLRQEKEEVERLKKEKQTLEENTMKKLSEMENALCKASGQVERANATFQKLEVENTELRKDMEAAKLHVEESAASCQEVSKREKMTLMKFQSWERQKTLLQQELMTDKLKVKQLLQELEQAKVLEERFEDIWKHEEKVKGELLMQANSIKKEREEIEASARSKENMIKSKAEKHLMKYKDDIQKLEKEISQLRLQTDSSKIAALRSGIDGGYVTRLTNIKNSRDHKDPWIPYISEVVKDFQDYSGAGVKRERECVMCLSEEMSVVFLPCAHQVVCPTCNELHEKRGMKDCPSCRSPIQQRISVCYDRS